MLTSSPLKINDESAVSRAISCCRRILPYRNFSSRTGYLNLKFQDRNACIGLLIIRISAANRPAPTPPDRFITAEFCIAKQEIITVPGCMRLGVSTTYRLTLTDLVFPLRQATLLFVETGIAGFRTERSLWCNNLHYVQVILPKGTYRAQRYSRWLCCI
jgi:hypothetical protein